MTIGQVQKSPRASSRRSVLTSHEEGDHHVRNVRVRKRGSVTVGRAHQSGNHIVIVLRQQPSIPSSASKGRINRIYWHTHISSTFPTTPDDLLVKLAHLPLRLVPLLVAWQRQVGEHEVDRSETSIERLVTPGKRLVQLATDFLSLQSRRSREDGQFCHAVERVSLFPFASDGFELVVHEVGGLLLDERNVGLEVFGGKTKLDHALLLHQHFVRAVVDDTFSKDRGGQVLKPRNNLISTTNNLV